MYDSIQNLSTASSLFKKKVKKILTNQDILNKTWSSNQAFPITSSFF